MLPPDADEKRSFHVGDNRNKPIMINTQRVMIVVTVITVIIIMIVTIIMIVLKENYDNYHRYNSMIAMIVMIVMIVTIVMVVMVMDISYHNISIMGTYESSQLLAHRWATTGTAVVAWLATVARLGSATASLGSGRAIRWNAPLEPSIRLSRVELLNVWFCP